MALTQILALIATLVAFGVPRNADAQPCATNIPHAQGQWATLPYLMPINPISATLMRNGRVLIVSGSENDAYNEGGSYRNAIWDPTIATQDAVEVQSVDFDTFCSGVAVLGDGRPLIVGGTSDYTPPFWGDNRAAIFDPQTNAAFQTAGMAEGRWYATTTVLADGRVMAFSGNREDGSRSNTVEIFDLRNVDVPWSTASTAPFDPPLYPRMALLPNGTVFFTGQGSSQRTRSWLFDPGPQTWTASAFTTANRYYGSSVLFPLNPPSYRPKVMNFGGQGLATTEIIDLGASNPVWTAGPNMAAGRVQNSAVLLPNGKVLSLGGTSVDKVPDEAGKRSDLYDPVTNTMASAGTASYSRTYHSVALLLPDATVVSMNSQPSAGAGGYEPAIEIYSPPYLFDANDEPITSARPSIITSVPSGPLGYDAPFNVSFTSSSPIASAVLIRPGSSTHATDSEQRMIGLCGPSPQPPCTGAGTLSLVTPPNGNIAPPGYYMLFLVDSDGVPSTARFIQLTPYVTSPPVGVITSPASDQSIVTGDTVSFQAAPGASGYSWVFPGGTPATSNARTPGDVTFAPGKHAVSLTVVDATGNSDPSPPTRMITSYPFSPDFEISVDPPWWFITPGQSVQYTVTVTSRAWFTGNVTLSLDVDHGFPAGVSSGGFSTPMITGGTGSSTLTINTAATARPWAISLSITGTSGSLAHTASTSLLLNLAPPATLNATAGNGQVSLSWPAVNGATSYHVKRSRLSGGPYVGIGCTNTTGYTDTTVTNGTTYYYVVSATFGAGPNAGGEGANSVQRSATPGGGGSSTTSTSSSTSTSAPPTSPSTAPTSSSTSTTPATTTTPTTTTAPGGTTTTLSYTYQEGATGCGNAKCGAAVLDVQISDSTNRNGADLPVGSADPPFRLLFEFDVSDIAAGKVITGASLDLTLAANKSSIGGKVCRLRRADWSETQATWTTYKTGSNWTAAGASDTTNDVESPGTGNTACVSYAAPVGTGHAVLGGLGPLVQDAVDLRSGKLRLRIKQDTETAGGNWWRAIDSESTPVSVRPKLTVTFANGGGTTTTTGASTTTTTTTAAPTTSTSSTSSSSTSTSRPTSTTSSSTSSSTSTTPSTTTTSTTTVAPTTSTSSTSSSSTSTSRPTSTTSSSTSSSTSTTPSTTTTPTTTTAPGGTTTTSPGGTTTTLSYTYQEGATGCGNAKCGAAVLDVQISDSTNRNGADLPVGSAGPPFRLLFEFDVSDIAAGKVITGASLDLTLAANNSSIGGKVCRLRRADWSETQATWTTYKTGSNWTAAGASDATNDVESPGTGTTACVSYAAPVGTGHAVLGGLGPLVQDAVDSRSGKLRLRIKQDTETAGGNWWRANDSESTPVSVRPKLTVTFANTTGPQTSPCGPRRS